MSTTVEWCCICDQWIQLSNDAIVELGHHRDMIRDGDRVHIVVKGRAKAKKLVADPPEQEPHE